MEFLQNMHPGDGAFGCKTQSVSSSQAYISPSNLPVGLIVVAVLTVYLRIEPTPNTYRGLSMHEKMRKMDPLGCVTFMGAVCCLLLALQWGGQTRPWESATIIGLLVGTATLLGTFIIVQFLSKESALIPLHVLSKRSMWTGAVVLYGLGSSTYLVSYSSISVSAY